MIKLTDIVYCGNGFVATFDDNSVANTQFKVVDGKLTVIGLNPKQKTAMDVFNNASVDTSDVRFQGPAAIIDLIETTTPATPAPPEVDPEVWTPADILGSLLWLDPSDVTTMTFGAIFPSGNHVTAIRDKIGPSLPGSPVYSFANPTTSKFVHAPITDPTTGIQGNGLNFMHTSDDSNFAVSTLTFIPSGGTLGNTNTGNVGEEWTMWWVMYAETSFTQNLGCSIRRGGDGNLGTQFAVSPASAEVLSGFVDYKIHDEWTNEASHHDYWNTGAEGYQDPSGKTVAFYIQSYNNQGTMEYRFSQDGGVTWPYVDVHGLTPSASVGSAYNVWSLEGRPWGGITHKTALGECGFINGAASAIDLSTLHTYLTDKWDLDI